MSDATIRFAPDILRRLGEELNPGPDQGILELVKNAYDADARRCTVELIHTDRPGGTVRIVDNGDGMTLKEIRDGWLILGRSAKSPRQRTRLRRIPAGSKGLGRLAALRMGSRARLITRPRASDTTQYGIVIDWSEYDNAQVVEDVSLEIRTGRRLAGARPGTEVLIEGVANRISRMDVKRLARAMILLADPFEDDPGSFKPILKTPEFGDLEALVKSRYFRDAEFHLIARVDDHGRAAASVVDYRDQVLWTATHEELTTRRGHRVYQCPEVRFDLWAFLLNAISSSGRTATLREVKTWLQEFGGVHLYQNDLRVAPYGNPGNDWLEMNLRRVQSPEERPSTNNSIGRVTIFDTDAELVQKTDRSGFIESEDFMHIRQFAQDALEWMARRRLELAEQRRARERAAASTRSRKSQKDLKRAIERAPQAARVPLREAYEAYDRSRDREVQQLHREVQLYRTLSTAGIMAATFAHESSGNPLKVITLSINSVERRAKKLLGDEYDRSLQKPVNTIKASMESLAVLGTATLNLIDHEKRRVGRVDLHRVIEHILFTFAPFIDGRDVHIDPALCVGAPYLRASRAAIESIITNLLSNSMIALERCTQPRRRLVIRTDVQDGVLTLRVLDNGPGIEGISKKDIWLPGQTTRKNGTGLGLTIVRDTVHDLGGRVDAIEHGECEGAEMIIDLPILGV